jgi:signal transduction histidine kinase
VSARVTSDRRRSLHIVGTVVICLVEIAIAVAFLWGRQSTPHVALKVNMLAWDWSEDGVAVTSVAGSDIVRTEPGSDIPGPDGQLSPKDAIGDVEVMWVKGLDGRSLESWISSWSWYRPVADPDGLRRVTVIAGCQCTVDDARWDGDLIAHAFADYEAITDLLAPAAFWLWLYILTSGIALATWLMNPRAGWRSGFLIGSVAITAVAVMWEAGLRPTDLEYSHPMVVLFALSLSMMLVFWSSAIHVISQLPSRSDALLLGRRRIAALYLLPQLALVMVLLVARISLESTMAWIGTWLPALQGIIAVLGWLGVVALVRVRQRTVGGRWGPTLLVTPLVVVALATSLVMVVGVAVLVLGLAAWAGSPAALVRNARPFTSGPAIAAVAGIGIVVLLAVVTPTAFTTTALGLTIWSIYPLPVLLLGVAVLRYRVYDVDVLRDSQRRAAISREEERMRIRRDLHDGLGPMLASMTLNLDLAREQIRSDPTAGAATIDLVKGDTQRAVVEVRRVVRDLRPSALDELGLVDALRARIDDIATAARQVEPGTSIEFTSTTIPALDPATEAAAYLIVLEAVTNVVRHAQAQRCIVTLAYSDGLDIEVTDDGVGITPGTPAGVGLTTMRERAVELGGTWRIGRSGAGWTQLVVHLPIQP